MYLQACTTAAGYFVQWLVLLFSYTLQAHQYETVSGFICETFGYIPKTGESINVVLEKAKREESSDYNEEESERHDEKNTHQAFKLEVLILLLRIFSRVIYYPEFFCN